MILIPEEWDELENGINWIANAKTRYERMLSNYEKHTVEIRKERKICITLAVVLTFMGVLAYFMGR